MEKWQSTGVLIDQGKGRAGNVVIVRNLESLGQSLHENRFTAAEIARQSNG